MRKIAIILTIIFLFTMPICATNENAHNWYCVRNKTHTQPILNDDLKFIEDYGCYYVDKKYEKNNDKVIYLTFDFGYENGNVEKIVDIMKSENVNGSFFILENVLNKNTDLILKIINNGNIVCNHTANHKDITKLSRSQLQNEIISIENLYKEKTGKELSKYFRPPEGKFTESTLKFVNNMGYKTVFWSFAYDDWDNDNQMSKEKALDKIMSNIHNGAIILLHPTSKTNADILKELIVMLKEQGYSFMTLDNL